MVRRPGRLRLEARRSCFKFCWHNGSCLKKALWEKAGSSVGILTLKYNESPESEGGAPGPGGGRRSGDTDCWGFPGGLQHPRLAANGVPCGRAGGAGGPQPPGPPSFPPWVVVAFAASCCSREALSPTPLSVPAAYPDSPPACLSLLQPHDNWSGLGVPAHAGVLPVSAGAGPPAGPR